MAPLCMACNVKKTLKITSNPMMTKERINPTSLWIQWTTVINVMIHMIAATWIGDTCDGSVNTGELKSFHGIS